MFKCRNGDGYVFGGGGDEDNTGRVRGEGSTRVAYRGVPLVS